MIGRLYKMLIPRFKNGSLKSMTCSLCDVIVRAATAKSAFYKIVIPFFSINVKLIF